MEYRDEICPKPTEETIYLLNDSKMKEITLRQKQRTRRCL